MTSATPPSSAARASPTTPTSSPGPYGRRRPARSGPSPSSPTETRHFERERMADNVVQKYSEYDHHAPDITLENVHESWDNLRGQCPIGRSDAYGGMWVVTGFPEA